MTVGDADKGLSKTIRLIKGAVYETLYLCAKDSGVKFWWLYISILVDFFQLLAFPVQHALRIGKSPGRGFQSVFTSFLAWISLLDEAFDNLNRGLWIVIYSITAVWTFAYLSLIVLVGYRFSADLAQSAFSLKLLRSMAMLSSTILFLPFVSVLLQTFQCTGDDGGWTVEPSSPCFGAVHITLTILVAVMLPCFILVSVFIAAVFFERDLKSNVANAQVHGRGDMLMLVNKVILSLLFGVLSDTLSPWILQLFLFASSLCYLFVYMVQMPYLNFRVNEVKCAAASGFFLACFAPFLLLLDPEHGISAFFLLALVVGPITGALLCNIRHKAISVKDLQNMHTSHDISIWARKRIQTYERLKKIYASSADNVVIETNHTKSGDKDQSNAAVQVEIPAEESSLLELGDKGVLYHRISSLLDQVERAYQELLERYPCKGTALLEASTFFRHYHNNLYMEMLTLSKAERNCSSIDTQFVVYQRLKQLREGDTKEHSGKQGGSNEGSMNAVDRVMFDQRWKTARNEETNVRKYVYQLWQTLMSECPDLAQMQQYAEKLTKALETADEQYQECLGLDANSAKVLRGYGQFLKDMKGDVDRASEYLNKADRVEDSAQRNKQEKVDKFIVYDQSGELEHNDESSAVIIISGDPSHIGEILEVNAAASNLFGRSKSELIGSNVSTIIPSPYSKYHDLYLKRFARTGKSFVIDRTRSLFGKTGSNVLIPLIMHFREVPPDQQQTVPGPRFSAVMHSPKTSENFLLFDNEKNGFTIIHADSRTHALFLGIDPNQLAHLEVSLSHYLPQLEDKKQCNQSARNDGDEPNQREPSSFSGLPRNMSKEGVHNHHNVGPDTQNTGMLRIRAPGSSFHSFQGKSDECWNEDAQENIDTWESFLRKLQGKDGEYEEVFTRNTADPKATKILARVQAVEVPDYGYIYLLAWKLKGKKGYQQNQEVEQQIDISQTTCPFAQEGKTVPHAGFQKIPSNYSTTNYNGGIPKLSQTGVFYNRSDDASVVVNSQSVGSAQPFASRTSSTPVETPACQEETAKPISFDFKNEKDDQNGYQGSQIRHSWGNTQTIPQQEGRSRKNSVGKSSTGTNKSVTNLLRYVIQSGATGLNQAARTIKWLLVILLIVYMTLAIISSVKLDDFYGNSFGQAVNVDQGGLEMNTYFGLKSSTLKLFITNSPYKDTIENQDKAWTAFNSQGSVFIEEALKSRSHSRTIGGSSHQWSFETKFDIQDRLSKQTEIVSFHELREFAVSHARELLALQNSSEFRPTSPPNGASLLLDNSATINEAMELSIGKRTSQFMSFMDESQTVLTVITFTLLSLICIITLGVICYSLYNINVKRKNILKTFLLLAPPIVKQLRDAAAVSLREHLETVNKLELAIGDDGSESSRSVDSELEDEDEENSPSVLLKPRTETDTSEPGHNQEKSTNQYYSPSRGSKVFPGDTRSLSESKYALQNFRRHKDSSKATLLFLAQLTSPLIVLLIWGIFTFANSSSSINAARQEVKRIRVAQNMLSGLLEYEDQMNLLALRVKTPQFVFGNASQEQLKQFRDRVTSLQRSIAESSTALVEGGKIEVSEGTTSLNTLSASRKLYDVWQQDGCSVLSEQFQTICQAVDLRHGVRSFLRTIFNRGNEIIAELPPLSEDNNLAMEKIVKSRSLQRKIRDFNSLFYPLPYKIMTWVVADHLLESISKEFDNALEAHRVATAVCVVLFAILVVIVSVPVMQKLTQTLVASVSLLVLIPESAISSNRTLRYQVKDVTQRLAVSNTSTEDAAIVSMLSNR